MHSGKQGIKPAQSYEKVSTTAKFISQNVGRRVVPA